MGFGEVLSELAEYVEVGDGGLVGEDGVAVVVAEFFAFAVEPAGINGGLEAPGMEWQGEVVADPGDVVLGRRVFEDRVGVAAVGALHIFEFDDGDARAGGGFERGGVVHGRGGRRTKLRAGSWGCGDGKGGYEGGEQGCSAGEALAIREFACRAPTRFKVDGSLLVASTRMRGFDRERLRNCVGLGKVTLHSFLDDSLGVIVTADEKESCGKQGTKGAEGAADKQTPELGGRESETVSKAAATGILGLVMLGFPARFHPLAPLVVGPKREGEYCQGENGKGEMHKGRSGANEVTIRLLASLGRIACAGYDAPAG